MRQERRRDREKERKRRDSGRKIEERERRTCSGKHANAGAYVSLSSGSVRETI